MVGHLDWVKFAHSLALGRSGGRRDDIIARYIEAWRELYKTEPPMVQDDTLPACFLDDPQYQPEGIPWFVQENSATGTEGQDPVIGPSNSTSRPASALGSTSNSIEGPVPDREPSPSIEDPVPYREPSPSIEDPAPDREPSPSIEDSAPDRQPSPSIEDPAPDREPSPPLPPLIRCLKEDHFSISMGYPYPGIKGGLNEGYADHLRLAVHERIRAIFIILPFHHLQRDYEETADISNVSIGQTDYDKISAVCPKAIYKAKDQKDCDEGQVNCFMDGWVRNESNLNCLCHAKYQISSCCWESRWMS
jgi:hypothetical protein